jgi:hypothetical protein
VSPILEDGGVSALMVKGRDPRRVASGPKAGEQIPVRVPTSVAALLQFRSGAMAQLDCPLTHRATGVQCWKSQGPRARSPGPTLTFSPARPSFGMRPAPRPCRLRRYQSGVGWALSLIHI